MQRLVSLLIAGAAAGSATAQDFNWSGRLTSGQTLEVRGVNGSVDAVAASGTEARVTARKVEGRRGNADDVEIITRAVAGGMVICVVYPGNEPEQACPPDGRGRHNVRDNDVSVHFQIEVPAGVTLKAHTVNGDVDVRNVGGDVEAHSVNGDVRVSTAGLARASTVNGSLRVRMGRADWTNEAEFSTVNGSVTLEFPEGLAAEFRAETVNGDIDSDFPITIRGRFGPRRATGTIGGGGNRQLSVRTVNGSIVLRRV
ncbi:MAG: DUF4097 family beta strand repeat-containing protein [Gemmatimonadales bacterium]